MRSFLSRFTLTSVAALALGGLIAGCSGGSSSLPSGPQAAPATLTNKPIHVKMPGMMVMTRAQISQAEAALAAARRQTPQRTSNGTGAPGAFGMVTTSSPPGPYFGMTNRTAVYSVNLGPVQRYLYFGSTPLSASIYLFSDGPGGACLIPFSLLSNTLPAINAWGYLDECSTPTFGAFFQIFNTNAFTGTFVKPGFGTTPPFVDQLVAFNPATTTWSLFVRNQLIFPFLYDLAAISVGASTVNGNFGGFFWVNSPEILGPCPLLPSAGFGVLDIGLETPGTLVPTPLAQSMPGGTFTGFNAPPTNVLRCFTNDGTGSGAQFTVNNGSIFPTNFYNANGGQMVVTSF